MDGPGERSGELSMMFPLPALVLGELAIAGGVVCGDGEHALSSAWCSGHVDGAML